MCGADIFYGGEIGMAPTHIKEEPIEEDRHDPNFPPISDSTPPVPYPFCKYIGWYVLSFNF